MSTKKNKFRKLSIKQKFIIGIGSILAFLFIYLFLIPCTGDLNEEYLYIPTGATYEQIKDKLTEGHFVTNMHTFDFLAKKLNYPNNIHPGKYLVKKGTSTLHLLRLLKSGKQEPVKLVINKLRTLHDFLFLISTKLETDTSVLKKIMKDNSFLSAFHADSNSSMALIIPDTYEMNWNTPPDKLFEKLQKAYTHFWTTERQQKAAKQKLSLVQTAIIASIVEEETHNKEEKPMVAAVYINRLRKGMKLQADPTAKFAYGDFTLRRITEKQTSLASPYNTYYITGLPIGPICTPSISSLDGVLNAQDPDVLFFCAKEDGSGHRFAKNYEEHLKNADLYHKSLDQRGIH